MHAAPTCVRTWRVISLSSHRRLDEEDRRLWALHRACPLTALSVSSNSTMPPVARILLAERARDNGSCCCRRRCCCCVQIGRRFSGLPAGAPERCLLPPSGCSASIQLDSFGSFCDALRTAAGLRKPGSCSEMSPPLLQRLLPEAGLVALPSAPPQQSAGTSSPCSDGLAGGEADTSPLLVDSASCTRCEAGCPGADAT